jgi:AcrR family transcriptional regulator
MTSPSPAGQTGSRRDELLELAATMFAERGLRATTVCDIADSAGILSGSLYHHFSSKEEMELVPSCDCIAVELVGAVVADGSASGREPPRVVLILTWGRVEVARTGFRPWGLLGRLS